MADQTKIFRGNILVVDDTRENLKFLVKILEAEGYTARPSLRGELALIAAQKEAPDLILLDIMMPGMDGYQVAAELQRDEGLKEIPIIFISALNDVQAKVKSFAAGGVDYVTKPFQAEELLARIETHLTLRKLRHELKDRNKHLEKVNTTLQRAMDEIKALKGILPICSFCKKIRDDKGDWEPIEVYIGKRSDADFSHGVCPDCAHVHYSEYNLYGE